MYQLILRSPCSTGITKGFGCGAQFKSKAHDIVAFYLGTCTAAPHPVITSSFWHPSNFPWTPCTQNHTSLSYNFHLRNPCVRKVIILTSHPTSCGNFFPTVGTNAGYQHGKHVDPRTQNGTPIYGVSVCHLNWKPRCLLLMLPILQLPKGRCDEYVV